jgi:predicted metal-dependent hydrolase
MGPRPRDRLGRPLPAGSGQVDPDPPLLPPEDTLALAQALLHDGRAFRAHEVLETRWKASTGADRDFWRGLAQLAVGLTHAQRGNAAGARALLARAAETLAAYDGERRHDVDVSAVRRWALDAANAVSDGSLSLAPPRLRSSGGG